DICKHLGADTYLSGSFGREYLDTGEFCREGGAVLFHEYQYRPYRQCHGGFLPFLRYLDTLVNAGLGRDLALAGGSIAAPAGSLCAAPYSAGDELLQSRTSLSGSPHLVKKG